MCRIARNLTLDYLHTRRHAPQRLDGLPLALLGTETPTYHAIGLTHWVQSSLAPKQRQVIELVYFQGYTHQQIADVYGIPLGTVKTSIRQALQCLRKSNHRAEGLPV